MSRGGTLVEICRIKEHYTMLQNYYNCKKIQKNIA